jgi:hypothetical protein
MHSWGIAFDFDRTATSSSGGGTWLRLPGPSTRSGSNCGKKKGGIAALRHRGQSRPLMLAHGFAERTLAGLVRAELATRYCMPFRVGGRTIEVTLLEITPVGRRAATRR